MLWKGLSEIAFVATIVRGLLIGYVLAYVALVARFARPILLATLAATATLLAIVGALYDLHHNEVRPKLAKEAETLMLISPRQHEEVRAEYEARIADITFTNTMREHFGFEGQPRDGAAQLWGPQIGVGFFAFEVLVALWFSTLYPLAQTREPVCPMCSEWLTEDRLGHSAHGQSGEVIDALLNNDLQRALGAMRQPDTRESTTFVLACCKNEHAERSDPVLRVRDRMLDRSGQMLTHQRADLIISQDAAAAIRTHLENLA
jgi:hypothetical protein